jgi:hypothetical protein
MFDVGLSGPMHHQPPLGHDQKRKPRFASASLVGCAIGAFFGPFTLYFACLVFLRDTGGVLIWPLVAIPFALFGGAVGAVIKIRANKNESNNAK